jgi:quinol monooxygenase YgiN
MSALVRTQHFAALTPVLSTIPVQSRSFSTAFSPEIVDGRGYEALACSVGDGVDEGVMVPDDVRIWVVAGSFRARPGAEEQLIAVLANYVVLTRMRPRCRNVDLVVSATDGGRLLVVEKWDDADAPRAHLDEDETVEMARAAVPLLADKPDLDLYETVSAHDLA